MSKQSEGGRERAEARFNQAQRTTDEARAVIDGDLEAARKKTARLRKERLAKEAREGVTELDKKKPRRIR